MHKNPVDRAEPTPDDLLERAISAMDDEAVPDGPSPQLVASTLAALEQAEEPARTRPMKSRALTLVAGLAVVAVAAGVLIAVGMKWTDGLVERLNGAGQPRGVALVPAGPKVDQGLPLDRKIAVARKPGVSPSPAGVLPPPIYDELKGLVPEQLSDIWGPELVQYVVTIHYVGRQIAVDRAVTPIPFLIP